MDEWDVSTITAFTASMLFACCLACGGGGETNGDTGTAAGDVAPNPANYADADHVSEPSGADRLTAGYAHTCSEGNGVVCWGLGSDPSEDEGAGDHDQATTVRNSGNHVTAGGHATCWNGGFELFCWGDPNIADTAPTDVEPGDIALESSQGCVIDDSEGELVCWGGPSYIDNTPDLEAPSEVAVGQTIRCVLEEDGSVSCWDAFDRESNGDHFGLTLPPEGTFEHITMGLSHACAITEQGDVECWGLGSDTAATEGEDFRNEDYNQASPPGETFTAIDAGARHTCGIREDGTLRCWGAGVRPNKNEGSHDADQAVPPRGEFEAVASGPLHTCAIDTDGRIHCWGSNDSGQAEPFVQ
jgi:alpha-tubulin suppressor-like RCC1 family protein